MPLEPWVPSRFFQFAIIQLTSHTLSSLWNRKCNAMLSKTRWKVSESGKPAGATETMVEKNKIRFSVKHILICLSLSSSNRHLHATWQQKLRRNTILVTCKLTCRYQIMYNSAKRSSLFVVEHIPRGRRVPNLYHELVKLSICQPYFTWKLWTSWMK